MAPHDDAMVEVELVDDDEPVEVPAQVTVERAQRGRTAVIALVVAVLAVVVGVVTTLVRPAPPTAGAVRSLDGPLQAQWQAVGAVLGAVGEDVVVQSDIFQVREVRVIDASSGDERWRARLGATGVATTCFPAVTVDPAAVWCVRNRRVVVDPVTGETSPLEPALVGLALSDGEVLVERVTPMPSAGFVAVDDDLVLGELDGAALTVQRVDPGGWEPVWTTNVALLPRTTDGQFDARIDAAGDVVVVRGPTVAVLRAADGVELARWEPVVDPLVRTLEAAEVVVTDTGFAAWTELAAGSRTAEGTWYDLEGRQIASFDGGWAEPATSDGTGSGALLITREPGTVTAVDVADGRDLWSAPAAGGALLRRDDAVVLADGDTLTSIEVVSGLRRWTVDVTGLRPGAGAVTDGGSIAVMAFREWRWHVVAIDLRTGEVTWSTSAPGIPEVSEEVNLGGQARLFAVGDRAVVRWGRALTWVG